MFADTPPSDNKIESPNYYHLWIKQLCSDVLH